MIDFFKAKAKLKKAGGARWFKTKACEVCVQDPSKCSAMSQTLWPDHCVQGAGDDAFPPGLVTKDTDVLVRKGTNIDVDSYSGFRNNSKSIKTELPGILENWGVK